MVSNEELKNWLDEVIRLQKELSCKFTALDKIAGIRMCTSNLDHCVQFYTGINEVLGALGIEPVIDNEWSSEDIAVKAHYNEMELIQLKEKKKEVENDQRRSNPCNKASQ